MSVAVRVRSFGARGGFGGAFPGAMPQGQAPLVARLPQGQAPLVARLPPAADAQRSAAEGVKTRTTIAKDVIR